MRSLRIAVLALSGLFPFTCLFAADSESRFVHFERGDLPIIVSAPHGGDLDVPDVEPRRVEGLPTGGSGYVVSRDTGTSELAADVVAEFERRFHRKPYVVIARSHRKFVDVNRPPEIAYEDADAKPVYEAYHAALQESCRAVQKKFNKGLLLDLHGQGSAQDTVFRGTHDGKTVILLRERFGETAHTGEHSLFAGLKNLGWKVHPDPLDGKEQSGFRGGYIVQTYGSHQGFGIDAMQLEFGADYRSKSARNQTAATLVKAVADYSARFFDLPLIDEKARLERSSLESPEETVKIRVGLYQGPGTGDSRSKLIKALEKQPGLQIIDITVDDIIAGKLQDCQVLIHPGGSGSAQGKALGEEGRQKVRDFVSAGGGFVGICAGAYLASVDYDWSLHILDAKVVDRPHWNRGFGTVELSLSTAGRELFETDRERLSIYYHQGPLLAPGHHPDIEDYIDLAKFETEIARNGAPAGVMQGCTAIAAGVFRKGRVVCISPHPESTTGEEPLLRHAIVWTTRR